LRKAEQNLAVESGTAQATDTFEILSDFQLGRWQVDVSGGQLRDGEQCLRLEPRLMQILVLLADNQGAVVSRQQIFDSVWPNQEVSDQTLDSALSRLRSRLGDDSRSPTYIQTVPKKGYRLLIRPGAGLDQAPAGGRERQSRKAAPFIGIAAIALAAVMLWMLYQPEQYSAPSVQPQLEAQIEPELAVLPFINLDASGQVDEDYEQAFSALLLEQLARVPGLQVVSQASAFRFSSNLLDTPIEVQRAAQLLGADYLLGGKIERRGSRLIVRLQLAEAQRGELVWTQALVDKPADALQLHTTIVSSLTKDLLPEVTGLQAAMATNRPRSGVTYDLYLLGRHYWHQRRPDALAEAERLFREALAREPDFALAHAGLANTYLSMIEYGGMARTAALALAQAPMAQAMRLAPELAETHLVVGRWHLTRFEWAEAEASLKRALALNPNLSMALMFLGNVYNDSGQLELAYASYRDALALDPLHATVLMNLSQSALKLGLHDRAHRYLERARGLFPQHTFLLGLSAHQLQAAGDKLGARNLISLWEQKDGSGALELEAVDGLACAMLQSFIERPGPALDCLDAIENVASGRPLRPLERLMALSYRAWLLEALGRPLSVSLKASLAEQIQRLKSPDLIDPTVLYEVAVAEAALARKDAAIASFLRAQRHGARDTGWMTWDPRLDPIRDEPEVHAALMTLAADQTRRGDQVLARFPSPGVP